MYSNMLENDWFRSVVLKHTMHGISENFCKGSWVILSKGFLK